jgi:CheY-like chemotaxis protein
MKPKILIVNDDLINQTMLKQMTYVLLNSKCEITSAMTFQEAADLVTQNSFHAIVLDGQLPDGHGRGLLEYMNPGLKNVTLICSGDEGFINECKKNGMATCDVGTYHSVAAPFWEKIIKL